MSDKPKLNVRKGDVRVRKGDVRKKVNKSENRKVIYFLMDVPKITNVRCGLINNLP